jgi:hypothetical protein
MPFFLEYSSEESAGRFRVEEASAGRALAKAVSAADSLRCVVATLFHNNDPNPAFGAGTVIAEYSRQEGWRKRTG